MADEVFYMCGIVFAGFAVNYLLRALPFLLFAGHHRALPPWVERLGNILSPVIIGCLVVYAYSGAAWRTPWPYLAGGVTVLLQVVGRNPLVSIVAGTLVYMVLLNCCGCAVVPVRVGMEDTEIVITSVGVEVQGRLVAPSEVPMLLQKTEVPRSRTVHVLVEDSAMKNLSEAKSVLNYLRAGGYVRNTLVTRRISVSSAQEPSRLPRGKKEANNESR